MQQNKGKLYYIEGEKTNDKTYDFNPILCKHMCNLYIEKSQKTYNKNVIMIFIIEQWLCG